MVALPVPDPTIAGGDQTEGGLAGVLAAAHIVLVVVPEQDQPRPARMPIRTLEVLAAHLLRPPAAGPGMARERLFSRLALLVRRLLEAQSVTLLLRDEVRERYQVVREADSGAWLPGSEDIPLTTAPLPQLQAIGAGMVLHRSSTRRPLDWAIRHLVGHGPALIFPIGTGSTAHGVLIAHLTHAPHDGEALLAVLLGKRAGAMLAGKVPGAPTAVAPRLPGPALADPNRLPSPALSQRQMEVARLLAAGLRNKEIAAHLGIREKTVKFHLGHLYDKLGVQSRTEALLSLLQYGSLGEAGDTLATQAPR